MTLAEQVLDKLAKEYFISVNPDVFYKTWKQMKEDFTIRAISLPEVERVVKSALLAKQAEVFKEINSDIKVFEDQLRNPNPNLSLPASSWAYRQGSEDALKSLKKRLSSKKKEAKKKNVKQRY